LLAAVVFKECMASFIVDEFGVDNDDFEESTGHDQATKFFFFETEQNLICKYLNQRPTPWQNSFSAVFTHRFDALSQLPHIWACPPFGHLV